jgi:hypothetical protein
MVAPTTIASAMRAAAMTTVVALTSPRSTSFSADAVNRIQKYCHDCRIDVIPIAFLSGGCVFSGGHVCRIPTAKS